MQQVFRYLQLISFMDIQQLAQERCIPYEVAWIAAEFKQEYEQGGSTEELQTTCLKALQRLHDYSGCLNELDEEGLLQSAAGSPSTLATYLTTLRVVAEQIPYTPVNTLYRERFDYDQEKAVLEPYPLAYSFFTLTTAERGKRKAAVDRRLLQQHLYPRRFRAGDVICRACELIQTRRFPNRVAAGLLLLTGRRTIEIFQRAEFTVIGDRSLRFKGQAKSKGSSQSRDDYDIPVLADPYVIMDAFHWLRRAYPCEGLTGQQVNRKVAPNLNRACKLAYERLIVDCSPHDLRAAYAEICLNFFWGQTGYNVYFSQILGHSKNDVITALRYKKFELI
jgi:integrase